MYQCRSTSFERLDNDKRDVQNETPPSKFLLPTLSITRICLIFMLVVSLTNVSLMKEDHGPPKMSLGSAAISSITEELSPILPFAGGMDLRRADYWSTFDGDWFGTLKSVAHQVNEAFVQRKEAKKELRESSPVDSRKKLSTKHVNTIAAPKPFASVESIAALTLDEVAVLFRYATESSNQGFSYSRFVSPLKPKVRSVVESMRNAVRKSRGHGVKGFVNTDTATEDGIDALKFAAAMRVFAEWRMVRLVPEGFKGFAVGMSLGHKDVVQNLVKMEDAVHFWLDQQTHIDGGHIAPSLRQLLSFEVETGIHPENRLPRLTEKTAGMGLLWVSRQLSYQTHIFDNILHVNRFASSRDAIGAAYKSVYDQYHGWAVQKIFSYSFQAAPEAEVVLRHMNPNGSDESLADAASVPACNPNGWFDSFYAMIGYSCKGDAQQYDNGSSRTIAAAKSQIKGYLSVSKPIILHLQKLFAELNMDDPTRV